MWRAEGIRVQRERVGKNIPDKRNSICEDLEESESMKLRGEGRNSLLVAYEINSRTRGEKRVSEMNRLPIMKGLISHVEDTGIK